jgi:D-glycerate 3-kinase
MRRDASTQPAFAAVVIERTFDVVHAWIQRNRRRPLLVGVSGLQGSGKSTLARQLAALARARGLRCEILALDDFYFGRRQRARLARDLHPLLATRGVPGTHEIELLRRTLGALARASTTAPVRIPRFDKGRDTRMAPSRWRRVTQAPGLVLLEGWCVGVPPQGSAALSRPLNALEREEDAEGTWRGRVDAQLAGPYAQLWQRLDRLVLLQAPRFDVVERWRGEQERDLRRRGAPRAMDRAALQRFLSHYERLSRHALRTLPEIADVRLILDPQRRVRELARRT